MAKIYHDTDADLGMLAKATVAIVGYGNQGRAQALNLRDSGVRVVAGSIRDASWQQAEQDGFETLAPAEAAARADILLLLVPDEVQRELYERDIAPNLRLGAALGFGHGYNIRYRLIQPAAGIDVFMVAPRMIGVNVRNAFVAGGGVPAYVAVAQDATGRALARALAIAKGIGATRAGVVECTFEQEADLDLWTEQGFWPMVMRLFLEGYEFLVASGFPPEMAALELYGSGEAAEIFHQMAVTGFFRQMNFHSHTSQYGTLTRQQRIDAAPIRAFMQRALEEIRDGTFAREWAAEQRNGYPVFEELKRCALAHPLNATEEKLREIVDWSKV
jgi:ketol-acid reductoisomerase